MNPAGSPGLLAGDVVIRPIDAGELAAWATAMDASFLEAVPEGAVAFRTEFFTPGRSLGLFAGSDCLGTLRSLDLEVTVPGRGIVAAEGITNVAVIPSVRRRGLLTAMMRRALDGAVGRGRCLSALIASEYRIYGRFGFGPATRAVNYEIDVRRAGAVRVWSGDGPTVEVISLQEAGALGRELHERFRRTQPGAIGRSEAAWRQRTGKLRSPYRQWHEPTVLLCRSGDGTSAGMAMYHAKGTWEGGDPDFTLFVDDLIAVHPGAAAALWRQLLTTEWVTRVVASGMAPDGLLPLLLDNPRACMLQPGSGHDHLWLRILDTARALESRSYDSAGRFVLEVIDRLGYAAGCFALESDGAGRSRVTATSEPPDLTLDASALAMTFLGDQTMRRLACAGLVAEHRDGALDRADRMMRTPVLPWCPDGF